MFGYTDFSKYAGKWIATVGKKVVTEGGDAEAVYKVAKNKNTLMMLNFQLTLHGHLKRMFCLSAF